MEKSQFPKTNRTLFEKIELFELRQGCPPARNPGIQVNPDSKKVNPGSKKVNPDSEKVNPDPEKANPDSKKVNPGSKKVIPAQRR